VPEHGWCLGGTGDEHKILDKVELFEYTIVETSMSVIS
jgi:hypothetical protein